MSDAEADVRKLREELGGLGIALFIFLWTVIAIVAATTSFIALGGKTGTEWLTIFGYMAAYFYLWAGISVAINWLVRHARGRWSHPLAQAGVHLGFLTVLTLSLPFLTHPGNWQNWLYGDHATGFHSLNAFVYAFVLICSMLWKYYHLNRQREQAAQAAKLRQVELERSLDVARMEALRAQVNPHFLFNTLNSIASLVESSANREAYKVIELLAALLRNGLDFSRDSLVTLEKELEFLSAYVEIEKVRYGARLEVITDVPPACLQQQVPSFALQPLVENAIKHAVAQSAGRVTVQIRVSCAQGRMQITVADDGPGLVSPIQLGVGLNNMLDRLRYLFGQDAALRITNNAKGGASVTMTIPGSAPAVRKKKLRVAN
ncbi:MAG: histidine kinase [Gammaproteobacteria bacterium]|nr:histidine kinase [Gammaproteobacteria bacterium]MDH5303714.1 histidine kinase [Gammaproteobacteria bacterium]MDH5322704.1 histidine kinase [Gammaproteobacteria bacterium]